eukprot:EG_transcript_7774
MRKRELGEGEADPTAATAKRQRAAACSGEAVEMDLRSSVSDSGCQQIGDRGSQLECVVKMYCVGQRQCRLNEVVEFVGILHPHAPAADDESMTDTGEDFLSEQQFDSASDSLRFSLHALHMVKAPSIFCRSPATPAPPAPPPAVFDGLVGFLAARLAGDRLCATYLLLHMCSGVYDRKGSLVLGALPLNVVGPHAAAACRATRRAWDLLLERHCAVHLDLPALQAASLLPAKDFRRDCLRRAALQLPPRTFLAVDETALAEGRLNEQGLRNLAQLNSILEGQTATYDFQYHTMEVETDYPSVVFSHTKSLLHSAGFCVVPFEPQANALDEPALLPPDDPSLPLAAWRRHLSAAQHQPAYRVTEAAKTAVEEDIAAEMRAHPERFNRSAVVQHNTLHLWFTLARLLALARGQPELSLGLWNEVKALEAQRCARLPP